MNNSLTALPIDPLLPEIVETVRLHDQVILTATPGAGKTTRLPPQLLNSVSGKVVVLQPRRIAAIAAAQRIADELGWQVGKEVGYQVRHESKGGPQTRLIFMTDALLLRRLIDDPELHEFDLVVIDEFHERNLNQDLILGVLKELQELGRTIKLLIMSATLELTRLQDYLPQAQKVEVPGKVFPLDIRYSTQSFQYQTNPDFYQRVVESILSASRETSGDILVFLPGVGEIQRTENLLHEKALNRDVYALHGSLPLDQQREILKTHSRPRVILATNIAEASLTVPGVDFVIDTGLVKVMRVNLASGFSRLELARTGTFNSRQRAGRAAREKPGVCLRLWTPHDEMGQAEALPSECQRLDLSSSLLLLAHLGVRDFQHFAWLETPHPRLLQKALDDLHTLAALDERNQMTEIGDMLLQLPLTPRWGAFLLRARGHDFAHEAYLIAALMQERDLLMPQQSHHSHDECDLSLRLQLLEDFVKRRGSREVHARTAETVLQTAAQLEKAIRLLPTTKNSADTSWQESLLRTQTDRLCRRRGKSDRGLMVGGRGVRLDRETQVRESEFFLALDGIDQVGQAESMVHMASGFAKAQILSCMRGQIKEFETPFFDEEKGQFYLKKVKVIFDLELEDPVLTKLPAERMQEHLVPLLVAKWTWLVQQNSELKHWFERWSFFVQHAPEHESEISEHVIQTTLEHAAFGKKTVNEVVQADLVSFLEAQLPKNLVQLFKREAPQYFTAPTEVRHSIQYDGQSGPYVEIRLQEMFGVTDTPNIGFGKVPITFRLLAPNFRPVQTTSDIKGFWERAYVEVKKELKGRYPKHPWPDDPLRAPPVAKGRRRN